MQVGYVLAPMKTEGVMCAYLSAPPTQDYLPGSRSLTPSSLSASNSTFTTSPNSTDMPEIMPGTFVETPYGPDPLNNQALYSPTVPVIGQTSTLLPSDDKTTIEKLLTEIRCLQDECLRLNEEIRRLRTRTTLAKETYDGEDLQELIRWTKSPKRAPPLKREAPEPATADMNNTEITPCGIEDFFRVIPSVLERAAPAPAPAQFAGVTTCNERGAPVSLRDIKLPFMPGEELGAPDYNPKSQSGREFSPWFLAALEALKDPQPWSSNDKAEVMVHVNGENYPLSRARVKHGLGGTRSLEVVPPPDHIPVTAPLQPASPAGSLPAPDPQPEKSLAEMIAEAEKQGGEPNLKRDRRFVPPPLARAVPAPVPMSVPYNLTSTPSPPPLPAHNRRRNFIPNPHSEIVPLYQPQQWRAPPQPKALRRVSLLGLCTTLEINALPDNERMTLRGRLCKILLTRTTENTMDYNQATSRAEHLSEVFECSVLDAFDYAGLDLSKRVWVTATKKTSEGGMVIAGDDDVGGLLWVKGLLEEMSMDEVSRRELVLWANHVRRRIVGMPSSPIWMRELVWRTVLAVILYIECLHAREV